MSRSKNLRNGAAKINGTVLMPGEEFSAYTWLTPFTVENGYASAGSYANGQVDTVGGGLPHPGMMLYNAALLAEMDITQRQNHSMIVTYVPASQDSAIAGTYKDLKFKNPYDTPIYMEGAVNGGTISFTIYGKETRPANRTIKYVSETLSKKDPGEPITKVDASLKPPTPTKAAIAVREIVRSTAQKNRAGVTALPVSGRHARRFIRGRNRVSAVCTEAVPSFFPAARCAAVSARTTRSAAKALEKIFPERAWRKFFWNCRHRARIISIW